jgi:protein gp37
MSDLFQDGMSDEYTEAVSQVMATANWHTYQVLTKRSERLRDLLSSKLRFAAERENIWWGVVSRIESTVYPGLNIFDKDQPKCGFCPLSP